MVGPRAILAAVVGVVERILEGSRVEAGTQEEDDNMDIEVDTGDNLAEEGNHELVEGIHMEEWDIRMGLHKVAQMADTHRAEVDNYNQEIDGTDWERESDGKE